MSTALCIKVRKEVVLIGVVFFYSKSLREFSLFVGAVIRRRKPEKVDMSNL